MKQVDDFQDCAALLRKLMAAVVRLEQSAAILRPRALAGREWFELLRQKLLPQLSDEAFLVAAVVGGTNIGKSVIFNHLAGCRASASSPLASGTKHVTCLVPDGFAAAHDLNGIFPDFELQAWSDAKLALEETDKHRLYWRTAKELPPSLLILDTPDIDSDARVNWVRADAVRRCADVLIAVLTQQKYNDAAVKEFFRKAADEDKAVIVVFNQCLLPDDEPYWPIWLNTFCHETGVKPEAVYLAPSDRRAAEELRLPFFERSSVVIPAHAGIQCDELDPRVSGNDGTHEATSQPTNQSLATELSQLKFREIRLRTLRGSLRELVHHDRGVPAFLRELSVSADELGRAASRLTTEHAVPVRNWPSPANSIMVAEIRAWWNERQHGWARTINSAYTTLGNGVLWPVRAARRALQGEPVPPLTDYKLREWDSMLAAVEGMFERLEWMADSGNELIRPRIESILRGDTRARFLEVLRSRHADADVAGELKIVVDEQMQLIQLTRPELFGVYRQLNNVSAAVRPMTSVVLFTVGFGPAGELVAPFVANAAAAAVVHVVADVAGGATAAIAGEAAVASAAGSGAGMLQAWFHQLHSAFVARRAGWLTKLLHEELLGSLPEELQAAARIEDSESFKSAAECVSKLEVMLRGDEQ